MSNVYDYGATLTQAKAKAAFQGSLTPGLYSGFVPTILGTHQLSLSVGVLMSPGGVFHMPTTPTIIPDFPVLSSPADYTLVATHDDIQASGGSSFQFRWVVGIKPRYDVAQNAVSVLYVRQQTPGSLAIEQLSQPAVMKNGNIAEALDTSRNTLGPAFDMFSVTNGPNITVSRSNVSQYLGALFTNAASTGLQTSVFLLPIPDGLNPKSIRVHCQLPVLGSVVLSGICEDGSSSSFSPTGPVGPLSDLATATVLGVLNPASPLVALLVTVTIPAGFSCFLNRVVLVGD